MNSQDRIIKVNSCESCPFNGECEAWKKIDAKTRVWLTISTSVPQNMMLKDCPLEKPENEQLKDTVIMPKELTAENGAKHIFMGEFEEVVELGCHECDQDDEECECCNGNGTYTYRVPITWDAIKSIYALAVKKLSK